MAVLITGKFVDANLLKSASFLKSGTALKLTSMIKKLFSIVLVLQMSGCSTFSITAKKNNSEAVSSNEDTIFFFDTITSDSAIKFKEKLNPNIKKVVLSSVGGRAMDAMDIAELIFKHQLDVEVKDKCFSACANYLFPAGKIKTIGENAVVMWHGCGDLPGEFRTN